MKKRIRIGLIIFILFLCSVAFVCYRNREFDFDYELKNGGVRLTKYIGHEDTITLPKRVVGFSVVGCEDDVFQNINYPHTVIIPDEMTYFASFKNDSMLEKVVFEKSEFVKIIDEQFMNCTNLKEVQGLEYTRRIGDRAFMNCEKLDVNLSDLKGRDFNGFGNNVFDGTMFEKSMEDSEYTVVGGGRLIFYNGPIDEIVIPKGVEYICNETLFKPDEADKVQRIYMPDSVGCLYFEVPKNVEVIFYSEENWTHDFEFLIENSINGTVVAEENEEITDACKERGIEFRSITPEELDVYKKKMKIADEEYKLNK